MNTPLQSPILLVALSLAGCVEFQLQDEDQQVTEPTEIEEIFEQSPMPKVDVLWVVDNTRSMTQEQQMLSDGLFRFVEALDHEDINWQAGVVTTDVSGADAGVLQGTPWLITSNLSDPLDALQDAAHVGLWGQQPEAGLGAAWMALSSELTDTNRGFRRPDAALHVVVFSDEDDKSAEILGSDPATRFVELLEGEAAATGRSASFSAVVGASPSGCIGPGGTALPADTYLDVVARTGGTQGNICEADFESLMTVLANQSVEWKTSFVLQAKPEPNTLRVQIDGQRVDDGWSLLSDPASIKFEDAPLPDSEIRIRYEVSPQ